MSSSDGPFYALRSEYARVLRALEGLPMSLCWPILPRVLDQDVIQLRPIRFEMLAKLMRRKLRTHIDHCPCGKPGPTCPT